MCVYCNELATESQDAMFNLSERASRFFLRFQSTTVLVSLMVDRPLTAFAAFLSQSFVPLHPATLRWRAPTSSWRGSLTLTLRLA